MPWKLADRLAEGLALLRVPHRLVERALGEPDRHRGHGDPAALQHLLRVLEAAVALAQEVRLRDAHALEDELGRVGGVKPELLVALAGPEPRHPPLEDERRHAAAARGRVGLGHDDRRPGDAPVRDERLRAVEHEGVVRLHRAGPHRRRVRARSRARSGPRRREPRPRASGGTYRSRCAAVPKV